MEFTDYIHSHICLCTHKSLGALGRSVYTSLYRKAQKSCYTYSVSLKGVVLISFVDNTLSLIPLWFTRKPLHPLPLLRPRGWRTQRSHFVRDWAVLCPTDNGSTPLTVHDRESLLPQLPSVHAYVYVYVICSRCCHLGATIRLTLNSPYDVYI